MIKTILFTIFAAAITFTAVVLVIIFPTLVRYLRERLSAGLNYIVELLGLD